MPSLNYRLALGGTEVQQELGPEVVSLTVEEGTDAPSTLRLRLRDALRPDGSWNYLDDDRLSLFSPISVKLGYPSGGGLLGAVGGLFGGGGGDSLAPVFDGYITAAGPVLGSHPNSSFLDITAMDTSVLMSLEEKIATWPDLADSDIVQQVLSNYSVSSTLDSTSPVHQSSDTTVVQRGTDLQFVRGLAQKNGLEFYFETDQGSGSITAYWRAPQLGGTPQPDLAIQFGDGSNLRRFSARAGGLRPLNVQARQVDVKAGTANSAQVGSMSLSPLGANDLVALIGGPVGSLVTPKDAPAQMLVLGTPTADLTELTAIVQAVRDEAAWFITAEGEINSDAYGAVLRPRRLVLIKGAGKAYSGKYYVTRVVHTVRSDGTYGQAFEARRNARDVDGSEQFGGGGSGVALPGL